MSLLRLKCELPTAKFDFAGAPAGVGFSGLTVSANFGGTGGDPTMWTSNCPAGTAMTGLHTWRNFATFIGIAPQCSPVFVGGAAVDGPVVGINNGPPGQLDVACPAGKVVTAIDANRWTTSTAAVVRFVLHCR